MYATDAGLGLWGGAGEDEEQGLEERLRTNVEAAKEYLREKWTDFLAMGPRIIDLQHRAALISGAARERGDIAGAEEAKDEIRRLGELNKAHGWAVDTYQLERVGERLGLGAWPVVAGALAYSGLAAVMLWAFRAYSYSERKLDLIEQGVLTPDQAAALDPGPSPGRIFRGATNLLTLAAWGVGLWFAFQLAAASGPLRKKLRNPPLEVWNVNPPEVMGDEVYAVTYRHEEDGQDYVHEFGPDVELEALPDGSVLLTHRDGRPLWDEFEVPAE